MGSSSLKDRIRLNGIIGKIRNIKIEQIPLVGKSKFIKTGRGKAALALALALMIAGSAYAAKVLLGSETAEAYSEFEVAKGDIEVVISGSGTVEPAAMYNIVALVQGDVLQADFEEGDTVEKDQLLYVIDSEDMENTLEQSMISLEKATMSYQDSADAAGNLNVKSSIAGKVGEVYVARNDSVSKGAQIAKVYDDSSFTLKVPFAESDAGRLRLGQTVDVVIESTFETLTGKITRIYDSKRVLAGSQTVTDVEVEIVNPGALNGGVYATVSAGGISSYEGGELEYASEKIITADSSGTVEKVYCTAGEYVKKGTVLAVMSSEEATDAYKSGALSLRDAQLSYANTKKQLDNYNITAPISGTIIEKSVKAGDIIDTSDSTSSILAVIADMSTMVFEINVDELDIAKMEEGQKVNITADALPDSAFTGYVDNVGINGETADGVTSYPVRIVIDDPEGLLPGMNVNAEIVVESASDILSIPVTAVNRGNIVYVKGGGAESEKSSETGSGSALQQEQANGQSAGLQAPDPDLPSGYSAVRVELGISDDSYIEITDGLSEGDVVLVPVEAAEETTETMQQGMPGMGGGMPAGAPPQGGGAGQQSD